MVAGTIRPAANLVALLVGDGDNRLLTLPSASATSPRALMPTLEPFSTLRRARVQLRRDILTATDHNRMPTPRHHLLHHRITPDRLQIQRPITLHPIMHMPAPQPDPIHLHPARPALLAAQPRTRMLARLPQPWTRLQAIKRIMQAARVARGRAAVAAGLEALVAGECAAALGALHGKVLRLRTLQRGGWMARAAQGEGGAEGVAGAQLRLHVAPHGHARVGGAVADQVQAVLGAAEEDVDAVFGAEEARFVGGVAAHEGDNDHFGFFALEVVDCGEADGL